MEVRGNQLADRLLQLRHIKGLTQKELARKINISRSCLANYERGKRYPDHQTMVVMAAYFKVSVEYLTGEVGAKDSIVTMGSLSDKAKVLICEGWLDVSNLTLPQRNSMRDYLEYMIARETEEETVAK